MKAMLQGMLNLIFPRACVGCGRADPAPLTHLCADCIFEMHPLAASVCSRCGHPFWGDVEGDYTCSYCEELQPAFDTARSVLLFDGLAAELVRRFKYAGAVWLAGDLAAFLRHGYEFYYGDRSYDLITYVPLHPWRRRWRGYNQAGLLARALVRLLGSGVVRPYLMRVRRTESQTRLTARQRLNNVRGAFAVRKGRSRWLAGKAVLLIDDVMTTGATVSECARALKQSGAEKVDVLTLARTLY